MNSISLIGRLGKDPEIKHFDDGNAVANFTLAVNGFKDEVDWFRVEAWGKTATVVCDYCRKGREVGILGRMASQKWTDRQTGEERTGWVVKASHVDLIGKGRDEAAEPAAPYSPPAAAVPARAPEPVRQVGAPQPRWPDHQSYDQSEVPF